MGAGDMNDAAGHGGTHPAAPPPQSRVAARRDSEAARAAEASAEALAQIKARVISVARRIGDADDTKEQRATLRIEGARIPGFPLFNAWCAEGMRAAWQYDRDHAVYSPHLERMVTVTYAARNTLRSWHRLARHFVAHYGIEEDIKIRDTDHRGHYICELVPRPERDENWLRWARGGKEHGFTVPMLTRLRAQEAARQAVIKAKWAARAKAGAGANIGADSGEGTQAGT